MYSLGDAAWRVYLCLPEACHALTFSDEEPAALPPKYKANTVRILVLNSGSSSIKLSIFDSGSSFSRVKTDPRLLCGGEVTGIGGDAMLAIHDADGANRSSIHVKTATPVEALRLLLDAVCKTLMPKVQAVGYRVVHPGAKLHTHQRITDTVLRDLNEAASFAPLHDPEAITIIRECMARFPDVAHYACFDTVFHGTMPAEASTYPVPRKYRELGARRYGFHGLSCESIVRTLRNRTRSADVGFPRRMVIAHLGSGCSVTALLDGCSMDTTMGLTPAGGVVMGTRPGDLDPGLVLYLLRQQQGDAKSAISSAEQILNHASGIAGLSEMTGSVQAVREAAVNGDAQAALAMKVFTRSVTKAIGGFCWLLGGLDAIVFAGGIGENDAFTRAEVLGGLDGLGISIDARPNRAKSPALRQISAAASAVTVYVVPAQEDLMIAVHVERMARLEK